MPTTRVRADMYDTTMPLLSAIHREFSELSKKKPDGIVSKNKVEIVNKLLGSVFTVMDGEPERDFLYILDADQLPENSDVVLLLSQVVAAMGSFRKKHTDYGKCVVGR